MKYIDKSNSSAAKNALDTWKANKNGLKALCDDTSINPQKIWKKLPKPLENTLREALHKEQNSMCCYCGKELQKRKKERILEHFKPKSKDRWNRMFDYDNLLLSCHGNSFEWYQIKSTDSWESIGRNWSPEILQDFKTLNNDIEFKAGANIKIGYIKGAANHHCDNFKDSHDMPLSINLTTLPDCIDRFKYVVIDDKIADEIGFIKGNDSDAEKAIAVLNLNEKNLVEARKAIIKDTIDYIGNMPDNDIEPIQQYIAAQTHFYAVVRACFKEILNLNYL